MSPRLDIAAPRASPKKTSNGLGAEDLGEADPLGLWKLPTGPSDKGPNAFKLNQGRAIDVLRSDYPALFTQKPDLSIFTEHVELRDPSGKRLKGKENYEKVFDALRFLRRTTMQDAQVTYRLVVVDMKIKVRWSAKLWMRDPIIGSTSMYNGEPAVVHLDGVSNYDLDDNGQIYKHSIENIVMNGPNEAAPVQLQLAWPNLGLASPELAMPSPFFRPLDAGKGWAPPEALKAFFDLSEVDASAHTHTQQQQQQQQSRASSPIAAASAKPRAGDVKAMVPDEYGDETPMERAARERAEDAAKAALIKSKRDAANAAVAPSRNLFGLATPQPCETSYDCEQPDVCCDLLFGSVCCGGGMMIPTTDGKVGMQRQAIPIPVERDDFPPNGGSLPPNMPNGL